MVEMWNKFQSWWKGLMETLHFAMQLDMRALDDPAWLTGQEPEEETLQMVADAKKRAGL